MGFIFRTIFWLGLAIVVVPPEARLGGGDEMAEYKDIDFALELDRASATLWSLGSQLTDTCKTNPQLCEAGANLVDTTLAAAQNVATEAAVKLADGTHKVLATAESPETTTKKIQARVE